MRIAVACAGLDVAPYFAQRTNYMCYNVERGIVAEGKNIPILDNTTMKLASLMKSLEVDTVIVGRIEYDIASSLCRSGIEVVAGAEGSALDVVRSYLTKTLSGIVEPCSIADDPDWEDDTVETAL